MMKNKLNSNWITGFTDAEGCFYVGFVKNRISWRVYTYFQVKLHIKDKDLLLNMKSFFNEVGTIVLNN